MDLFVVIMEDLIVVLSGKSSVEDFKTHVYNRTLNRLLYAISCETVLQ